MTEIDYAARRSLVTAAIDALLTDGLQSYTLDGQTVTKLDLVALQSEEQRLIGMERRQARRGGGVFQRAVPR